VRTVVVSGDGKQLYSGGVDGSICVWDLETNKHKLTFTLETSAPNDLKLSSDGMRLFSGCMSGAIRIFDLRAQRETRVLHGHASVLQLSSDGKHFYSGGDDNVIRIWEPDSAYETSTLGGDVSGLLTLSTAGTRLYTEGGGITVWDIESGKKT